MKKRLLSLILAITMIATLLPAMALSAGAEDVGYTLTYDFTPDDATNVGKNLTTFEDYSQTYGQWKYYAENVASTIMVTLQSSGYAMKAKTAIGEWYAVKIYVPVYGVYSAALTHCTRNKSGDGGRGNVYLLPGTTQPTEISEIVTSSSTNPINSSLVAYGAGSNKSGIVTQLGEDIELHPGEYVVVFDAVEAGLNNSNQTLSYIYPQALTLTSGDGSLAAPMYGAAASIDKENITVGGAAANITVSGPMSDGSDITAATLTYAVTGDDCVTVTNGTVTGTAVGTANITTSVNGVALNTVTVNVAEAAPDYADYTFTYDFADTPGENNVELTSPVLYTDTQGMWSLYEKSRETMQILKLNSGIRIRTSEGYWAAFKINVPVGGRYKAVLNHIVYPVASNTKAGYGNVYLLDGNTTDIAAALEEATPLNGATPMSYVDPEITNGKTKTTQTTLNKEYEIESGEYILVFRSAGQYPGCHSESGTYPISFVLEGDEVGTAYAGVVTLGKNELKKNETTSATVNVWNTANGESVSAQATFVSDSSAVSVSGSTLTADALGKAKISATVADSNPISIVPAEVTVVDSTDDSVTFGVYSNIGKGVDFSVDGTLKRGDTATLTAEDVPGYKFVGWKRGNDVTGKFILGAPQQNFEYTIYSNAFITAIYEEANPTAAAGVELWNKNGELVAEYTAEQFAELSALPEAEMIGYIFNGWETADGAEFTLSAELGNGITRAVAKYTAKSVGDYTYNQSIPYNKTKGGFSGWLRDNRLVSYAEQYIYYVFNTPDVEEYLGDVADDKKPLVVLDEGFGAYMVEYDAADYEIVEAGIVASNGTPSVNSAQEKHIAQGKDNHGQFAVKLTEAYSNVRGYVIYKDGNDYKIVYSD